MTPGYICRGEAGGGELGIVDARGNADALEVVDVECGFFGRGVCGDVLDSSGGHNADDGDFLGGRYAVAERYDCRLAFGYACYDALGCYGGDVFVKTVPLNLDGRTVCRDYGGGQCDGL